MIPPESNPFFYQVVESPWSPFPADIPAFNKPVSDLCQDLIEEVARGSGSTSLLLCAPAGMGKMHLLARLCSALEKSGDAVPVSVPVQSAPDFLYRRLSRAFAADLLRESNRAVGQTRLDLVLSSWNASQPGETDSGPPVPALRSLATVLTHYKARRYRRQCANWLRGEPLDDTVMEALGLATAEDEAELEIAPEDHAYHLVVDLCRLAAPKPVVFVFDLIEALEHTEGDFSGLHAFAQMIAHLLADTKNVMAILPVDSAFEQRLERHLDRYLLEQLSLHRADLQPLDETVGKQLLAKRLDSIPQLRGMRANLPGQPLWPLAEDPLPLQPDGASATPRGLLSASSRRLTEALKLPAVESEPQDSWIAGEYRARLRRALDSVARVDLEELFATALPGQPVRWDTAPPPPLELTAAVEALRSLRGAAAGGNLFYQGGVVSAATVDRWFAANRPPALDDFLEEAAAEETAVVGGAPVRSLFALLERRPIINLDDAAKELRAPAEQLREYARHHPLQIGYLAGPPAVLFCALSRRPGDSHSSQ